MATPASLPRQPRRYVSYFVVTHIVWTYQNLSSEISLNFKTTWSGYEIIQVAAVSAMNNMIWITHELLHMWIKSFPHTSSIFYIPFLPRLRSISLEKFSVKTCSTSCARPGCRVSVQTATSPKNLECTCCNSMTIYREACSACCRLLLFVLLSPRPIISLFSACLILVTITTCISELNPSTPPHTRHVNISVNKNTQALNLFCLCLEMESVSICTSAFSEAFFWTDVISCY